MYFRSWNFVEVIDEVFDILVDSIAIVEELVDFLVRGLFHCWVADVELEESTEVREEGMLATKHIEVIVLATLHHEDFVCLYLKLLLKLGLQSHVVVIIEHLDVEFCKHVIRVVRVATAWDLWLEVIDLSISFTQEVIQSITSNCSVCAICLWNVITDSVFVLFVWLARAATREVPSSRSFTTSLSMARLCSHQKVLASWIELGLLFFGRLCALLTRRLLSRLCLFRFHWLTFEVCELQFRPCVLWLCLWFVVHWF